jgi:hypothetical protein
MKKCTKCNEEKDFRQFYKVEGKPMARCMDCIRDQYRKRYQVVVKPRTIEQRRVSQDLELYGKRGV